MALAFKYFDIEQKHNTSISIVSLNLLSFEVQSFTYYAHA